MTNINGLTGDPLEIVDSQGKVETAKACGFNRWMQHTRAYAGRRGVADETATSDLLLGKPEGVDVGTLAQGRLASADRSAI